MINLKEDVIHDGESYQAGEDIEIIERKQAQRLVDLGVAVFVGKRTPSEAEENLVEDDEEEKKHDVNYKEEINTIGYNDLKLVATEVGMKFKGNISKKDLISLIIKEGKAEEALSLTEEEE